ncbi:MAG: hypothetical protein LQ343_003643 [Gyalolechia ehrenbergii]|nr:MAG: hypothetical protein LQ343_003643 [Gyalolechia ehrenbergii]
MSAIPGIETPVSRNDIVDLRWQDEKLTVREIYEKMVMVMVTLDHQSEASIQLAETRAKNLVCIRQIEGSSPWSLIRARKFIIHKGTSEKIRNWLADFVHVGIQIMKILDSQRPMTLRNFHYVTAGAGKKADKARMKQMWWNWALTLEIHPLCFGINIDSSGVILIPTGLKIDYKTCSNLLTKETTKETLHEGRSTIPKNVMSVKLRGLQKTIRAVIVTEHRNLNTSFTGFVNHAREIIVIMTAGYPCLATREFLRLLADNRSFANTQFLWLSDHDPHGFQVYTTLKFGSAAMAWVAPSTCVPRLEFFGPTLRHVEELLDQSEAEKRADIKAQHPSLTDREVVSRAKDVMKSTRNKFADQCRNKLKKNDLSILKHVKSFCTMDAKLSVEVSNMLQNQCGVGHCPYINLGGLLSAHICLQKFAMSELDKISSAAALSFVLQAVD